MRIKHRGKVGIVMKREVRSMLSDFRLVVSSVMSANNAARFFFAQLFFGIFGFWFIPMPI